LDIQYLFLYIILDSLDNVIVSERNLVDAKKCL
jgi:hypothetical protein